MNTVIGHSPMTLVPAGQCLAVAHRTTRAHQPVERSLHHPPAPQHPRRFGGATPEQALAQANRRLVDPNPGRFAGCLYAHLDLARRQAVLATAGHPRRYCAVRTGHAEVHPLMPGLLLGIAPTRTIPPARFVETPGGDPDRATAGLAAQLAQAPTQPMDRLATDLIDHARQTAPRRDDIALLLIGLTAG
ncbi:SpoIIE family protein phosphatase [Streptomyces sp. NPDC059544]|uniref:SpoIIE family protein phosphatase n=1 Tax=Streptomyces sp. NPDC059544 TaxID=3346861 RepID=UPI0036BBB8C7